MINIRLLALFLFLKAQICYSQCANPNSLLNKFKIDIEIEQREHAGVVIMDDETKLSYYLLVSSCSVTDLIKYTNDSNPFVRSYVFAGLLRREISTDKLLKILDIHKNDTAKLTSRGADVVTEWTVKEFMQAGMNLKSANKLNGIDYKKEIARIKNQPELKFKINGISHGLIDKKELLNIDSLNLTDKELKVVSFTLLVAVQEIKSSNCLLTNEMKQAIERSKPGEFLFFDNIKVVTKDGMVRQLSSLSLRLK